jgi:hypothetical protein
MNDSVSCPPLARPMAAALWLSLREGDGPERFISAVR